MTKYSDVGWPWMAQGKECIRSRGSLNDSYIQTPGTSYLRGTAYINIDYHFVDISNNILCQFVKLI